MVKPGSAAVAIVSENSYCMDSQCCALGGNSLVGFYPLRYTLADICPCTDNFQKNVLNYYSGTTQDNETNDTPFESPIK